MNHCRICQQQAETLFSLSASRNSQLELPLFYCESCAARYTFPPEFDYDAPDQGIIDYYQKHCDYIVGRHTLLFEFVEKLLHINAGRFFDIGTGAGYSMRVAEERGWTAVGVEPSRILVDFARKQSHGIVLQGIFSQEMWHQQQAALGEKFDYILIDNVLEHVRDPVGFLQAALPLLKTNGVMVVAIPPVDWFRLLLTRISFIRNRCRTARWNLFYDPEQHVNYFSRQSMRTLVENRLGLRLLDARFHHSKLLKGGLAARLGFETGYYFISKL